MAYLSLYRKYRSQTFSDLIGQDHVVRTLQNAVASGKIAHSYLFTGPRGTGKTSSARLLSKCLNCEKGPTPEPCNVCEQCVSITQGNCVDVYELDAASESGVDNVRDAIVDAVQYAPNFCRYKIFIIDEVHDLSSKAFDALLKTIEEPPSYVVFILATTEYNRVPPTIRSRCQKYEFHRATLQNLVDRLTYVATSEGVEAEAAALTAIARMADGGYRDALTLLEQAMLTSEGHISLQHVYDQLGLVSEETVDAILIAMRHGNVPQIVDKLGDVARRGRDPRAVLESMMYRLSDLTRAAYTVEIGGAGDATREAALFETASHIGRDQLLALRGAIAEAHKTIRDVSLPRIWLEAELIRIATAAALVPEPRAVVRQETPAVREAQPPPTKTEARPQPTGRQEQPRPAVTETKQTAPPPKAEPEPPRRNPGDDPDARWSRVVADLSAISKSMGFRLSGTKVRTEPGEHLIVEFGSNFECEWVTGSPKRQAGIVEKIHVHFGPSWSAEFKVSANGSGPAIAEPEAVELPVEGEPLYKLASEILGQNGNSK